jgi:hypothetical protein
VHLVGRDRRRGSRCADAICIVLIEVDDATGAVADEGAVAPWVPQAARVRVAATAPASTTPRVDNEMAMVFSPEVIWYSPTHTWRVTANRPVLPPKNPGVDEDARLEEGNQGDEQGGGDERVRAGGHHQRHEDDRVQISLRRRLSHDDETTPRRPAG